MLNSITGKLDVKPFGIHRHTEEGEEVLKTNVIIRGLEYPVTGYETALRKDLQGKEVMLQGYLSSDRIHKTLFTHFHAITVVEVESGTAESTEMSLVGILEKRDDVIKKVTGKGKEVLSCILRYKTPEGRQCIVHMVAKGPLARKMVQIPLGETISVKGYWLKRSSIYEVELTDIQVGKKEE